MSICVYTCNDVKGMFLRVMPKHRPLTEDALQLVAQRFAVLAEPMRLRLIQALFDGERNVTDLVAATEGTQANVSRHLQTLVGAHILARRKEGLQVFYRISDPTIPKLCELVCGQLATTLTRQAAHFESAG